MKQANIVGRIVRSIAAIITKLRNSVSRHQATVTFTVTAVS